MVSLAKKLEGRPFHLLATHCQRQPKEKVVAYIKSKQLEPDTPNFTVSSFGGHPDVSGSGYVPYYMVFDHHGDLAYHHMCGQYHGGDGLEMISWIERLLMDTPAIYLGKEPYTHEAKLAKQISKKKSLPSAIKQIETRLATEPRASEGELQRLHDALKSYRDSRLSRADEFVAKQPSRVLPLLKQLAKDFKGTQLGRPVETRYKELSASKELKAAVAAEKSSKKIMKALDKTERTAKAMARARKKLQALIDKNAELPYAETLKKSLAELK